MELNVWRRTSACATRPDRQRLLCQPTPLQLIGIFYKKVPEGKCFRCCSFQRDNARLSVVGEDGHLADELYKKVRILCWVMTGPSNLETKARHVKNTWTRHCNIVVFMSSVEDPNFPTVGLGTKEGRDQLYWKTIRAFHYAYEHHIDEADWFLKADDDTYVIVDNLRWVLANHTPDEPIYFGRRFKPYTKQGYMSGGAGYVLSKEALRRFVEGFKTKVCSHTTSVEDLAMGQCMEKVGVLAGDSRDGLQRETFHPFVPEQHLTAKFPKSFWYWSYCYYPISEVSAATVGEFLFILLCLIQGRKCGVLQCEFKFTTTLSLSSSSGPQLLLRLVGLVPLCGPYSHVHIGVLRLSPACLRLQIPLPPPHSRCHCC